MLMEIVSTYSVIEDMMPTDVSELRAELGRIIHDIDTAKQDLNKMVANVTEV